MLFTPLTGTAKIVRMTGISAAAEINIRIGHPGMVLLKGTKLNKRLN
jgi:hypothetical protein